MNIIHEIEQAGVRVVVEGDRVRLKGPRDAVTDTLIEKVRQHKSEIMQALTPSVDAPLRETPVRLTDEQVERLIELMDGEPLRAFGWVLGANGRADHYEDDRAFSPRDADITGAVDWLLLRRGLDHLDDENVVRLFGAPR